MNNTRILRLAALSAALVFVACGGGTKKCTSNADCASGQICNTSTGQCTGGTGGGTGGGATGGGTGGGATGGGTGGGSTGGGTGGGSMGGGTGGGGGGGGMMVQDAGPGGETCEMATVVAPGSYAGTNAGALDTYNPTDSSCTGYGNPGPDVVYQVTVPAGQRLTASVAPEIATSADQFDPSLYLVQAPAANCNMVDADGGMAITCLGGKDSQSSDATETASWTNTTGASVDVFVVVDSYFGMPAMNPDGGMGATNVGNFTLTVDVTPPPADDVCGGATALTAGNTVNGSTVGYENDYSNGTGTVGCATGAGGADRAYSLTVPAGQRALVTVTPAGTYDPSVNLVEASVTCEAMPRVCAGGAPADNSPRVASYLNTTSAAVDLFAVVDSFAGDVGDYTIGYTVGAPSTDDTCTSATTVLATNGTAVTGSLTGFAPDYSTGMQCASSSGNDRVYKVTVPAGQVFNANVMPSTGLDLVVNLVSGPATACDSSARACVAAVDSGYAGEAEDVQYFNDTGAAVDLFLVVADYDGTATTMDFTITATVAPPPAGDTCGTAQVLNMSGSLTGLNMSGFTHTYDFSDASCVDPQYGAPSGPDRVWQIDVPAGQTLTVTVTPDMAGDPGISIVEGPATNCTATATCLTYADMGFDGAPETATYMNGTAATKTVLIVVQSWLGTMNFDLSVQVQ